MSKYRLRKVTTVTENETPYVTFYLEKRNYFFFFYWWVIMHTYFGSSKESLAISMYEWCSHTGGYSPKKNTILNNQIIATNV